MKVAIKSRTKKTRKISTLEKILETEWEQESDCIKIIEIKCLIRSLGEKGINAQLEPKIKNRYWLNLFQEFRIFETKDGVIFYINNIEILIDKYRPHIPLRNNNTKIALFLEPIPPRA